MAARGADTIFTAPVLIVRQKTKLIEVSNEYTILDQQGESIADVRQVGQGLAKKTLQDRHGTDIAHLSNTLDGLTMLDLLSEGIYDTFSSADS
jgi:uncharacterized protein YxjI